MKKKGDRPLIRVLIVAVLGYFILFARQTEASINILGGGATADVFSGLFYGTTSANVLTVTDDFSSDYYIYAPLSQYKSQGGKIYAADGSVSSRVVSRQMGYFSYNIGSAKLEVSSYTPSGGTIVYFLSNDDGQTWAQAQPGYFVNFNASGKTLRWSAVIARSSSDAPSPYIDSITITIQYGYDSDLYRTNDNKRISDLSTVAGALSDFYADYGTYPHVGGESAASNWSELMTFLSRNRKGGLENYPYLWSPLNDPLHDSDENITYNYKDLSQNEYILTATFQSQDDYNSAGGFHGAYGGINCSYPTYCMGVINGTNPGSGSQVLGAYTTGNTIVSTTRTNSSWPSEGLPLYSMIAAPLNNLLGQPIFKLGDYYETITSTETTTPSATPNAGTVAGASISKAAGVATGIKDSLMLSLILSTLVTLIYVGYTKTDLFKKREVRTIIKKGLSDKNRFNFAR